MSPQPEISIFLVQHIDDPRRHEARNVGVIISDSRGLAYRLIDPDEEHPSLRYRQALASVAADETYPAWFAYWTRALERGTEGLDEIIARQKATFPVIEAGRMKGDVLGDLASLTRRYFDELVLPQSSSYVGPGKKPPEERMLRAAGVMGSPHFHRDYEVSAVGLNIAVGLKVPLKLTFPYAWENGHLAVIEKVLYTGGDKRITNVLLKFGHVGPEVRCVVIVDRYIDNRSADLREYLTNAASIIRLDDPNAPERLRAALEN